MKYGINIICCWHSIRILHLVCIFTLASEIYAQSDWHQFSWDGLGSSGSVNLVYGYDYQQHAYYVANANISISTYDGSLVQNRRQYQFLYEFLDTTTTPVVYPTSEGMMQSAVKNVSKYLVNDSRVIYYLRYRQTEFDNNLGWVWGQWQNWTATTRHVVVTSPLPNDPCRQLIFSTEVTNNYSTEKSYRIVAYLLNDTIQDTIVFGDFVTIPSGYATTLALTHTPVAPNCTGWTFSVIDQDGYEYRPSTDEILSSIDYWVQHTATTWDDQISPNVDVITTETQQQTTIVTDIADTSREIADTVSQIQQGTQIVTETNSDNILSEINNLLAQTNTIQGVIQSGSNEIVNAIEQLENQDGNDYTSQLNAIRDNTNLLNSDPTQQGSYYQKITQGSVEYIQQLTSQNDYEQILNDKLESSNIPELDADLPGLTQPNIQDNTFQPEYTTIAIGGHEFSTNFLDPIAHTAPYVRNGIILIYTIGFLLWAFSKCTTAFTFLMNASPVTALSSLENQIPGIAIAKSKLSVIFGATILTTFPVTAYGLITAFTGINYIEVVNSYYGSTPTTSTDYGYYMIDQFIPISFIIVAVINRLIFQPSLWILSFAYVQLIKLTAI